METTYLSLILITILTLLYLYIKRRYSYWKDRNVVHLEPTLLYGNMKRIVKKEAPLTDVINEIYDKVKSKGEKFGGIYSFISPVFIPVDLDLVKHVLQTDFSHFVNHGLYTDVEKEPLTGHLFGLGDEKWKNIRAKLTPAFTTGKVKLMFQTLAACAPGLEQMLKREAKNENGIDIKDIVGRFTTDIIASVGFGLEVNSMENSDSDFRKYGLEMFDIDIAESRNLVMLSFLPRKFAKLLNLRTIRKEVEDFFLNLVKDSVSDREKNNIYRKDFLHLLIQLKNLGKVGENEDRRLLGQNVNETSGITLNELAAQCFIFFAAGFETSSSTMTYALLELAQRQDIQDKLREEINRVLKKYDNEITYEGIAELEYLEKTVLETLRMHPPLPFLLRVCTKEYQVPNSNVTLEVGTRVFVPALSIHRDPDYYPDPDKFEPERFSEENKAGRHTMAYMPFGEGPRTCIAQRLGKLQAKVGLCTVLRNYKVTLHDKTQLPVKYEMLFVIAVKGGVWINLEPLSKSN